MHTDCWRPGELSQFLSGLVLSFEMILGEIPQTDAQFLPALQFSCIIELFQAGFTNLDEAQPSCR